MAKDIVLKDTGFSQDAVTFTKCVKDIDDGITKYEIEIRTADGMEYDYEINAADGSIMETDVDAADYDPWPASPSSVPSRYTLFFCFMSSTDPQDGK